MVRCGYRLGIAGFVGGGHLGVAVDHQLHLARAGCFRQGQNQRLGRAGRDQLIGAQQLIVKVGGNHRVVLGQLDLQQSGVRRQHGGQALAAVRALNKLLHSGGGHILGAFHHTGYRHIVAEFLGGFVLEVQRNRNGLAGVKAAAEFQVNAHGPAHH
ncbi:hypothetical protein D3C75_1031900 [compost metagenome]